MENFPSGSKTLNSPIFPLMPINLKNQFKEDILQKNEMEYKLILIFYLILNIQFVISLPDDEGTSKKNTKTNQQTGSDGSSKSNPEDEELDLELRLAAVVEKDKGKNVINQPKKPLDLNIPPTVEQIKHKGEQHFNDRGKGILKEDKNVNKNKINSKQRMMGLLGPGNLGNAGPSNLPNQSNLAGANINIRQFVQQMSQNLKNQRTRTDFNFNRIHRPVNIFQRFQLPSLYPAPNQMHVPLTLDEIQKLRNPNQANSQILQQPNQNNSETQTIDTRESSTFPRIPFHNPMPSFTNPLDPLNLSSFMADRKRLSTFQFNQFEQNIQNVRPRLFGAIRPPVQQNDQQQEESHGSNSNPAVNGQGSNKKSDGDCTFTNNKFIKKNKN
ncbi:hypothetical protein Mgra_00008711 [Meloidogyne graminicola]|uniref:Uncharacterized protein n=1 Tax=Meloidogyne graminicola TaxID=189291 RepID=A0A8S9ZEZ6_9BILA|nr:hypothetical protein Mgra_00008711 [Meloidogyne graminicola]